MRKTRLRLQPDLDGDRPEVLDRQALAAKLAADLQNLLLVDAEIDVDRIDLHDGRELGRPSRTDERTRIDEPRRDDARERRLDFGVAEVDLRLLHLAFGLLERGERGVALGAAFVELGLARHLALLQGQLAIEVGLGLHQQCFLLLLGGLRDLEARLIGWPLDLEQGGARRRPRRRPCSRPCPETPAHAPRDRPC